MRRIIIAYAMEYELDKQVFHAAVNQLSTRVHLVCTGPGLVAAATEILPALEAAPQGAHVINIGAAAMLKARPGTLWQVRQVSHPPFEFPGADEHQFDFLPCSALTMPSLGVEEYASCISSNEFVHEDKMRPGFLHDMECYALAAAVRRHGPNHKFSAFKVVSDGGVESEYLDTQHKIRSGVTTLAIELAHAFDWAGKQ